MTAEEVRKDINHIANPDKAQILQRFFKTGPGQYGEGDIFWGIQVPHTREIVKRYRNLPLAEIGLLIADPVHEVRMAGALLLVENYKMADQSDKERCYNFYISQAKRFNNWDLVDLTCPQVVGAWLLDKDRQQLYDFAYSSNLWEQRISIISTFYFLRKGDFKDTFETAKILLNHPHDLIHKAVGWMLREVGKRNQNAETEFLTENDRFRKMPRTMLRYAIEKYPEDQRQAFLKKIPEATIKTT